MLKKLLKYEFAATARYILPLIVLLFVMSAAAGLCIRGLGAERTGRVAVAVSAIFVVLFFLAVIALAVVTLVVIVYRFYRSMLSQEGYLTHSLPVSIHGLLCSKLIAAAAWFLLTGACIYGCLFAVAFRAEVWAQVLSELRALALRLSAAYGIGAAELAAVLLEFLLLLLLGTLSSCLLFFASLAAGHTLSRHKLLASLGIFLALGLASQLLTMLLTLATGYRLSAFVSIPTLGRLAQFGHSLLIGGIVLNAAYCVLLYAATAYLLGRRLDLG